MGRNIADGWLGLSADLRNTDLHLHVCECMCVHVCFQSMILLSPFVELWSIWLMAQSYPGSRYCSQYGCSAPSQPIWPSPHPNLLLNFIGWVLLMVNLWTTVGGTWLSWHHAGGSAPQNGEEPAVPMVLVVHQHNMPIRLGCKVPRQVDSIGYWYLLSEGNIFSLLPWG